MVLVDEADEVVNFIKVQFFPTGLKLIDHASVMNTLNFYLCTV